VYGKSNYPYGFLTVGGELELYAHSASFRIVPSRGFGMVLLCNTLDCASPDELYIKAFETFLGEKPVPAATDKDDAAALAQYVGEYSSIGIDGPLVVTSTGNGLHMTWQGGTKECDLVQGEAYPGCLTCEGATWIYDGVTFWGGPNSPAEHVCSLTFCGHRQPHFAPDAGADAPAD
jgi:hypothetical protein